MNIGVIGSGSWGTALAILLSNNGHQVTLWTRFREEAEMLENKREHVKNLPGVRIPEGIRITTQVQEAVSGKEILVFAVPSQFTRSTAELCKPAIGKDQILVNVAKGLEEGTLYTMQEVINDVLPENRVVVLSGPSHAEEVARGIPTSVVIASHQEETVLTVQDVFMSENFRVYGSHDLIGIEMGGSLKNVIALAAGVSDGLGYGDNTKAALMTRGMAEISRLGVAMGAKAATFNGLSGIGDLIVTCTSMHSRNRRCGILIGQGASLEEALAEVKMVVEGVYSAKAALELAHKHQVEMPIIEQVNLVLFHGKSPREAVFDLMERDKKFE
ncbi:NAD(P)H-dependent glycerol-3-phosphate dehydrogenase [Anaerotalea alkaliphila]|uniref:Glycerol-3-phosphate dehydrogenase [NAD(P)+] n=1 Tax=Anaerotalea alkaliphila TaxID=2662126 RepID=A0A7X5HTD3_9FIRM|nr:NAD(P)H-dependent glycerol-3-phosphate dehydrogenase [Anaerotalea alkaliphila]NDL66315.1 NAD(P)H-dependent glycerol-3-phosphate dehydrogenase [Anaerotalea alkaliphila]